MSGARLDDEQVVRALYQEHAAALLAFVRRLTDDQTMAEDIVQETLLRAWRHVDELALDRVRPWLFATARRLVIDAHRARSTRPVEVSLDGAPLDGVREAVVTDPIDEALSAAVVLDALSALTPAHRDVLVDVLYRGRTAAEIAVERGLPAGTARSRIYYALRALRLALQERGVDEP